VNARVWGVYVREQVYVYACEKEKEIESDRECSQSLCLFFFLSLIRTHTLCGRR